MQINLEYHKSVSVIFCWLVKTPDWKLKEPQPDGGEPVTVEEALASLPNVIPNSNKEAIHYDGEESSYSKRDEKLLKILETRRIQQSAYLSNANET